MSSLDAGPLTAPRRGRAVLLSALVVFGTWTQAAVTITDPGQDVLDFTASAAELSGLSWLTGNSFYAVSDDANHIPLRVESPLSVGSIKVDMMAYRNLRYPLSSLKNLR